MCRKQKVKVYEYLFWTELVQKATSMSDKNKWQLLKTIHLTIKNVIFIITSGEASPTFGHANANFSVFIDRIRNQFLKK